MVQISNVCFTNIVWVWKFFKEGRTKHKLPHKLVKTENHHLECSHEVPTRLLEQLGQDSDDGTAARELHAPKETRSCNRAWRRVEAPMTARFAGFWSRFSGDPNPGLAGEDDSGGRRRQRRTVADDGGGRQNPL
ncbi:hypothetical protein HKD37_10G028019 [Glycine soja]